VLKQVGRGPPDLPADDYAHTFRSHVDSIQ
jgi:hypothetical protein